VLREDHPKRGEEMEEEMEMEEDSSSTVTILLTHGTFIPGRYGN
jgi:hypothetical protein